MKNHLNVHVRRWLFGQFVFLLIMFVGFMLINTQVTDMIVRHFLLVPFVLAALFFALACLDARHEAKERRRRRRPKPSLIASNWDRDEVKDFWA